MWDIVPALAIVASHVEGLEAGASAPTNAVNAFEIAPILLPTKGEAEETQLIDLRLLVHSPPHRRTGPTPEGRTSLERRIEANGLREPIEVRPCGQRS